MAVATEEIIADAAEEKVACSCCSGYKFVSQFSRQQQKRGRRRRCHICVVQAHSTSALKSARELGTVRQTLPQPEQVRQQYFDSLGDQVLAGLDFPEDEAIDESTVSEQDVEYVRTAFEKGDVSRGCYLAILSARKAYLQADGRPGLEDAGEGLNDDGPLRLSRKQNRIRPLNWGYTAHLDRAFGLRSFGDIVAKGFLPDAKDVSESMAALLAVRRADAIAIATTPADEDVWRWGSTVCISIGDGSTPRTAGLAAFMTKWSCISVDPELRHEWTGECPRDIGRLVGVRAKFEDYCALRAESASQTSVRLLVLLCVHSHARFCGDAAIDKVRALYGHPPTCLVAIPCCPQFNPTKDLGRPADVRYDDWAIFSHCRTVLVWKWPAGSVAVGNVVCPEPGSIGS